MRVVAKRAWLRRWWFGILVDTVAVRPEASHGGKRAFADVAPVSHG